KSPAEQGFWGIFEVFADTTVLCTLTSLVVVANLPENAEGGMLTAARAYSSALGSWAGGFLAAACAVFGVATVVCWAHYGIECVKFLAGSRKKRLAPTVFLVIFSAITIISPFLRESTILALADLALGVMTIINIPTLLLASRDIQKLTFDYFGLPASLKRQQATSHRKIRRSR
ncbi:MAG: sodium:alanine symporter family protein, partial [Clostridia bacterium]|nr:sodium:alanine symporter family protein [Clostridia bacterium]